MVLAKENKAVTLALMERIPEPELMLEEEQARAYSEADFSAPHQMFVDLFRKFFGPRLTGVVLDLGCGPADISVRFAKAYPQCQIHGVDGSPAMLKYGWERVLKEGLCDRIKLILGKIPDYQPPENFYAAVIVNSLLHHLPSPEILWETIKRAGRQGAPVLVMDLMRPESRAQARAIVEKYAKDEPEILRQDFYASLLASYTPTEVKAQLEAAGLSHFEVSLVSDRHWVAYGRL